jgi:hypothetical protein
MRKKSKVQLEILKSMSPKSCLREWYEHWMVGGGLQTAMAGSESPMYFASSSSVVVELTQCAPSIWLQKSLLRRENIFLLMNMTTLSQLFAWKKKFKLASPPWGSLCPHALCTYIESWYLDCRESSGRASNKNEALPSSTINYSSPADEQASKMRKSKIYMHQTQYSSIQPPSSCLIREVPIP